MSSQRIGVGVCILPERRMATFANTTEGICAFIALMADLAGADLAGIEPGHRADRRL